MRIAILTSSYPRFSGDGTAPFIRSIATGLVKFGHQVDVVAPFDQEVKMTDKNGVIVHRFHYSFVNSLHIMGHGRALESDMRLRPLTSLLLPFYLVAQFLCLWKVTKKQKTEVIYAHWVLPNGPVAALVAKFRHIPFILSLHGSDIYIAKKYRVFGLVAKWVFNRAASVTACSNELKQRAIELGAPTSTVLLPWGADPQIFKRATDKKELRLLHGWTDEIIIVSLGRLVNKKGFNILLKALPDVVDKFPHVRAVIGGEGPILAELKELAASLYVTNIVQFVGRIPWNEVPEFLASADIFVLPSIRDASGNLDGLPTVLLEAMGCGVGIIASDIGGVSLAVHDQVNGLLVTPGDVNELVTAIITLINDRPLCNRLGVEARKTIENELNWDNICLRIVNILEFSTKIN
jgi:glycosyltransferase involved in cell wall biosynthesis